MLITSGFHHWRCDTRPTIGRAHEQSIRNRLSELWHLENRNNADRCMPVLLRMQWLRCDAAAEARRLLCLLLVWLRAVPAKAGLPIGWFRRLIPLPIGCLPRGGRL